MIKFHFHIIVLLTTLFILSSACKTNRSADTEQLEVPAQMSNTTSEWIVLFDGKSFDGWHSYNKGTVGPAWQIADGAMYLDKSKGEGGDLITDEEYENFEFTLEWKISDCGNSGIFFNVVESDQYQTPYLTGPELQVLDNKCHPDAKIDTHRAGDLYDMIETSVNNVKPAGEWNSIRIRSDNGKMTFSQNDEVVVQFTMHNDEWRKMVANSKFKTMPGFGKASKGRLGLQDHGDMVWFRNIKIKSI